MCCALSQYRQAIKTEDADTEKGAQTVSLLNFIMLLFIYKSLNPSVPLWPLVIMGVFVFISHIGMHYGSKSEYESFYKKGYEKGYTDAKCDTEENKL